MTKELLQLLLFNIQVQILLFQSHQPSILNVSKFNSIRMVVQRTTNFGYFDLNPRPTINDSRQRDARVRITTELV